MKYFFILGSNPTLSLAEIYSLFGLKADYRLIDKDCLLLEIDKLEVESLINRLGGTIKIGKIVATTAPADLLAAVKEACQPLDNKKFFFGFSTYGKIGPTKALAMKLKKSLQADGVNSRWVTSKEKNLSSVAVEQSGLLKHGQEFVLIGEGQKIFVGLTEALQPFKDWSFRDYGRPERDDYSGMLPPKLARIMINLSQPDKTEILLDPFCGSGTVLSEAALLGCQQIIGSDISLDALDDTKANLAWMQEKYHNLDFRCQLFQCDARRLHEILSTTDIGRVVTEPYLGPSRGNNQRDKVIKELTVLYNDFLLSLSKILKPGVRVVMVWPIFLNGVRKNWLQPDLNGFSLVPPVPPALAQGNIKLTPRHTIIYGRPGQKVWREIAILVKK